jgi:hypothetical protein
MSSTCACHGRRPRYIKAAELMAHSVAATVTAGPQIYVFEDEGAA